MIHLPGRNQRMRLAPDAGNLAAQPRRREHLARVAQARGIERAPQQLHGLKVIGSEHLRHVLGLVHPHAVLAGQYALEQTFLVRPEALVNPETSPLRVLEKIAGAPLV